MKVTHIWAEKCSKYYMVKISKTKSFDFEEISQNVPILLKSNTYSALQIAHTTHKINILVELNFNTCG